MKTYYGICWEIAINFIHTEIEASNSTRFNPYFGRWNTNLSAKVQINHASVSVCMKMIATYFSTDAIISFHSRDCLLYCLIVTHNSHFFQYFLLVHSWSLLNLKFQFFYYTCIIKNHLGPQLSVWIMQVFSFSSVLINRLHHMSRSVIKTIACPYALWTFIVDIYCGSVIEICLANDGYQWLLIHMQNLQMIIGVLSAMKLSLIMGFITWWLENKPTPIKNGYIIMCWYW